MSSGTGKLSKLNEADSSCIYKRLPDKKMRLKLKSSRTALAHFRSNRFPINIRDKKDNRFRLGLNDCVRKGLIEHYPAMQEKDGEYVVRLKFTVIVKDEPILVCARSLDDELSKFSNGLMDLVE